MQVMIDIVSIEDIGACCVVSVHGRIGQLERMPVPNSDKRGIGPISMPMSRIGWTPETAGGKPSLTFEKEVVDVIVDPAFFLAHQSTSPWYHNRYEVVSREEGSSRWTTALPLTASSVTSRWSSSSQSAKSRLVRHHSILSPTTTSTRVRLKLY